MTRTEAERMKEDEAEDAIRRQSEACAEDERGTRTGRYSFAGPVPVPVDPEDWVMPG